METALQTKDEQYPLLMVSGGGDGGANGQPSAVVSSMWNVTSYNPKRSWLNRWPELLSACWMTVILLGISFLVFYAIGMVAYRRQPMIIVKCNNSKPASDVFYHHLIPRGGYVPFLVYSEYLSSMAMQYPFLRFDVNFLIDDSNVGSRHSRLYSKLIPYRSTRYFDDYNKREISDFQRKYQNVNITVMLVSKYMAQTPLKYNWRTIPTTYLPFYARIFSVWEHGGVGIDLATYSNLFGNRQRLDRRIDAILKQHNDGIKADEYADALNRIDHEEDNDNEFISSFYGLINQLMNETRAFFNGTVPFSSSSTEKDAGAGEPLVRTHRNKRDISEKATIIISEANTTNESNEVDIVLANKTVVTVSEDAKKNLYEIATNEVNNKSENKKSITANPTTSVQVNNTKSSDIGLLHMLKKSDDFATTVNKSEKPQFFLFYDFSVLSDGIGPSYIFPDSSIMQNKFGKPRSPEPMKHFKGTPKPPQLLSIDTEGSFVAASLRLHPFLGHLISAGCRRMHPKLAIQDALITQCSGIFRDDLYCDSIYVL